MAAIVAFDITKATSLENARKWKLDVDDKVFLRNGDNIPVVLFANKVILFCYFFFCVFVLFVFYFTLF